METTIEWLTNLGLSRGMSLFLVNSVLFISLLALAFLTNYIAKRIILRVIEHFVAKTKTQWDDILLRRKVFTRLSHLVPALVIYILAPLVFSVSQNAVTAVQLAAQAYIVLVGLFVIDGFLNAVIDIYRTYEFSRKMPIRGFVQVAKIILYFAVVITIISIALGKDPTVLLGGMGAMTAVLMLIFKDSLLGLVAGVQLSTNQMIRLGDWIEMPKFAADGDVIDVSLTTVKVQNWDKTISTIPTYALISDSFKNWRGMSESGGRRIKRSLNLDMTSVTFCTEEMLDRFRKFQLISDYISQKEKELVEYNKANQIDGSQLVNGRRLTNLGTFRAYLIAYLRHHPKIHNDMTFLVRQLAPTERGLPMEIYVFSNDQAWSHYEAIQADIFDHILAVLPQFELRVFQNPTGADFHGYGARKGVKSALDSP